MIEPSRTCLWRCDDGRAPFVVPGILTALLALCMSVPAASHAQQVRGELIDGTTRQPVAGATMTLLDTALAVVEQTLTNDRGEFLLRARQPGRYSLRAERLGYRTITDGPLELAERGDVEIGFYLWPEPVALDSLDVEARRAATIVPYLDWQGYYDRKKMGLGHFITPEEIERRHHIRYEDMFRGIPGVEIRRTPAGWVFVARACDDVRIWMDDVPTRTLSTDISDILAVEIYRGASTIPVRYGAEGACAAVLVWTKHEP